MWFDLFLCFDQIVVGALTFFLGRDEEEKKDSDSESEVKDKIKIHKIVLLKFLVEVQKVVVVVVFLLRENKQKPLLKPVLKGRIWLKMTRCVSSQRSAPPLFSSPFKIYRFPFFLLNQMIFLHRHNLSFPGRRTYSQRFDGALFDRKENVQKQEEDGKSDESPEGILLIFYLADSPRFPECKKDALCSGFHRNTRRRKKQRSLISPPSTSSTTHKVTSYIPSLLTLAESRPFLLLLLSSNDVCDVADFSEKLLKQLESSKERFEVKIMLMELISRLVGIHEVKNNRDP